MKILFIVSFLLILIGCAHIGEVTKSGFDITFHNNLQETAIYRLAWIDHDFLYMGPVEMAVGEIGPNEKHEVNNGYHAGIWSITWYDCRSNEPWEIERYLTIGESVCHITTTPKEDILQ